MRFKLKKDCVDSRNKIIYEENFTILSDYKYRRTVKEMWEPIPLFHTGPESHELTQIDKYLDSWLNRTQFVKI